MREAIVKLFKNAAAGGRGVASLGLGSGAGALCDCSLSIRRRNAGEAEAGLKGVGTIMISFFPLLPLLVGIKIIPPSIVLVSTDSKTTIPFLPPLKIFFFK